MSAGGVTLHYLDFGGTGEPIVLLAGAGNSAWIYYDFGRELAKDHRVFALTRRGHGGSDVPETGYDHATLADDLRRFLDAQKLTRVVLVGHSLAGEELTYFAGHAPDRVRALVYLDAAYDRSIQSAAMEGAPEMAIAPTEADRTSMAAYVAYVRRSRKDLARHWTDAVQRDVDASVSTRADGTAGYRSGAVWGEYWTAMSSAPPSYAQVKAPVLAIYSYEDERYQLPDDASAELIAALVAWQGGPLKTWRETSIAQVRAAIPTAKIMEMNAGHHMFIHRSAETLAAVRAFLGGL